MKWLFGSVFGIVAVIFLLVGCPFLAVAVGFYYFVDVRTQNWIPVTGEVTGMSTSQTTDDNGTSSDTYCPDVEFTTTDGETIDVSTNECSSPPAYETGDSIELTYNPDNPQEIQLKGGVMQTLSLIFKVVFGALGVVFVCGGLVLALVGVIVVLRRSSAIPPGPTNLTGVG